MLSQFCLKLTIGKVHNLLFYKNEKKDPKQTEKAKKNRKLKFALILMQREIILNFKNKSSIF